MARVFHLFKITRPIYDHHRVPSKAPQKNQLTAQTIGNSVNRTQASKDLEYLGYIPSVSNHFSTEEMEVLKRIVQNIPK